MENQGAKWLETNTSNLDRNECTVRAINCTDQFTIFGVKPKEKGR